MKKFLAAIALLAILSGDLFADAKKKKQRKCDTPAGSKKVDIDQKTTINERFFFEVFFIRFLNKPQTYENFMLKHTLIMKIFLSPWKTV